jgi:hypothetical protein
VRWGREVRDEIAWQPYVHGLPLPAALSSDQCLEEMGVILAEDADARPPSRRAGAQGDEEQASATLPYAHGNVCI